MGDTVKLFMFTHSLDDKQYEFRNHSGMDKALVQYCRNDINGRIPDVHIGTKKIVQKWFQKYLSHLTGRTGGKRFCIVVFL